MQRSPKTIGVTLVDYLKRESVEKVNTVIEELVIAVKAISGLKLLSFFKNPKLPSAEKDQWLAKIAGELRWSEDTKKILLVLSKLDQLKILAKIVAAMKDFRAVSLGVGEGEVISAAKLDHDQRSSAEEIIKQLGAYKNVLIRETVDPEVLGGVAMIAGDKQIDATFKRQLKNLEKNIY
jgi:F-type H+-transporting ATPase subunit delta